MAIDIQFAEQLATDLTAGYTGRIKAVFFTFDAYKETDKLTDDPWAVITPGTLNETWQGHGSWGAQYALDLAMLVRQTPNTGGDAWFKDLLTSWDLMINLLKKYRNLLTIERELRYDPEAIQTRATVIVQATATFNHSD